MTPIFIILSIPALVCMIYPAIALLVKKKLSNTQLIMIFAMVCTSIVHGLYACYYNTFFRQEYVLNIVYQVLALFIPPIFLAAVASMTTVKGVSRSFRRYFYLAVFYSALLIVSYLYAGIRNSHLYLSQALYAGKASFIGDFRYDLLIVVAYYGFLAVLMIEIILLLSMTKPRLENYLSLCNDYFPKFSTDRHSILGLLKFSVIPLLVIAYLLVLNPVGKLTSVPLAILIASLQVFIIIVVSIFMFSVEYDAHDLVEMIHDSNIRHLSYSNVSGTSGLQSRDYEQVMKDVDEYLERTSLYLNPRLTLIELADAVFIPQGVLLESIHQVKGGSFSDYLNRIRIEKALDKLLQDHAFVDGSVTDDVLQLVAPRYGFDDSYSFQTAFKSVMNESIQDWMHQ